MAVVFAQFNFQLLLNFLLMNINFQFVEVRAVTLRCILPQSWFRLGGTSQRYILRCILIYVFLDIF